MSIKRGFEAAVYIYAEGTWKKVKTIGDITYTQERTAIEVANRASNTKRRLSGMENFGVSFEVQNGSDPEDKDNFDAYAELESRFDTDEPVWMNFGGTLADGNVSGGRSECMLITSFTKNEPLDDLSSASCDMGISAKSASASNTPSTDDEDDGDDGNG